ncbi:MAG: hypothetical protein NTX12_07700 [Actinobacteria bacterium]|nr:hypothetical protein [Actinomycetota bacterium]
MNIDDLRGHWNEILNLLERDSRIAWIVFFDARIAGVVENRIILDFSDVTKFAAPLEYSEVRIAHREALQKAIHEVTGESFTVEELR